MQNIINFIENLNWGTVPNWIGNVSVPIILWLMTTRLNKQRELLGHLWPSSSRSLLSSDIIQI